MYLRGDNLLLAQKVYKVFFFLAKKIHINKRIYYSVNQKSYAYITDVHKNVKTVPKHQFIRNLHWHSTRG